VSFTYKIMTDSEIEKAFEHTRFGGGVHRDRLAQGVLSIQAGYICGHTLTCIMKQLKLISTKGNVLKKGRKFIFGEFYDLKKE